MKKRRISPSKAKKILHEGKAKGHDITEKQRKFFGARASGYPIKTKEIGGKTKDKSFIDASDPLFSRLKEAGLNPHDNKHGIIEVDIESLHGTHTLNFHYMQLVSKGKEENIYTSDSVFNPDDGQPDIEYRHFIGGLDEAIKYALKQKEISDRELASIPKSTASTPVIREPGPIVVGKIELSEYDKRKRHANGGGVEKKENVFIPENIYWSFYAVDKRFVNTNITIKKLEKYNSFDIINDKGEKRNIENVSGTKEGRIWNWLNELNKLNKTEVGIFEKGGKIKKGDTVYFKNKMYKGAHKIIGEGKEESGFKGGFRLKGKGYEVGARSSEVTKKRLKKGDEIGNEVEIKLIKEGDTIKYNGTYKDIEFEGEGYFESEEGAFNKIESQFEARGHKMTGDDLMKIRTKLIQEFKKSGIEFNKGGTTPENEIKYKGKIIKKLFPSGYYEVYSDKEGRFIKYDEVDDAKELIDSEMKSCGGEMAKQGMRTFRPENTYNSKKEWKESLYNLYTEIYGDSPDSYRFGKPLLKYRDEGELTIVTRLDEEVGHWDSSLEEGYIYDEPMKRKLGYKEKSKEVGGELSESEKEAKHQLRYGIASAETAREYVQGLEGNEQDKSKAEKEIMESIEHTEKAMESLMAKGGEISVQGKREFYKATTLHKLNEKIEALLDKNFESCIDLKYSDRQDLDSVKKVIELYRDIEKYMNSHSNIFSLQYIDSVYGSQTITFSRLDSLEDKLKYLRKLFDNFYKYADYIKQDYYRYLVDIIDIIDSKLDNIIEARDELKTSEKGRYSSGGSMAIGGEIELKEIRNELENLTNELNDTDIIMDEEWREHLEARRNQLWEREKELKNKNMAIGGEVLSKEKLEEIISYLNESIESHTTSESLKEVMKKKVLELQKKLSDLEKQKEEEIKKSQRNVTIPSDSFWVSIDDKYSNKMRTHLGSNNIPFTARTVKGKYTVYVNSQELLDKVVNIYNMKRAKGKDKPVSASDVSGKSEKGGKLWVGSATKKEGVLRNKAKRMGLLKNDEEKLSETDLKKLEQQGPKWKKRVQLVRTMKEFKQ